MHLAACEEVVSVELPFARLQQRVAELEHAQAILLVKVQHRQPVRELRAVSEV